MSKLVTILFVFTVWAGMPALRGKATPPWLGASQTECRWKVTELRYYIGPPTAALDGDRYHGAVKSALNAWTTVANLSTREVTSSDSAHIAVVWIDDEQHDWYVGSRPALADFPGDCSLHEEGLPKPVRFTTKNVYGASEDFKWSMSGAADAYDVKTVALHELGHALGLRHCNDRQRKDIACPASSVMFREVPEGQIKRRLRSSDSLRIRARYQTP